MDHRSKSLLEISLLTIVVGLFPLILVLILAIWAWDGSNSTLVPRGYARLEMKGESNIADERDAKYAVPTEESSGTKGENNTKWKVKALFVHPIKSCAGVEVDAVAVDGAGLLWDRKFAVAEHLPAKKHTEERVWTFRTMRQPGYEKLAKVRPEIWLRREKMAPLKQEADDDGWMVVRYPYIPSKAWAWLYVLLGWVGLVSGEAGFRVPLVPPKDHKYPVEDVTIWKDLPQWLNYGVHIPESFGRFLGAKNPVTLFRVDPQSYREVYRNAPTKAQLGYQPLVGFADSYPVHLLNLASVRDVAERVKTAIPKFTVRRFRSNVLVTGGGKYDEDEWKVVRIGGQVLYCACHTIRCRLPNVDPDTAVRHDVEPDKTLRSFRCIDPGDPLGAALGLQLVPESAQLIELKVGDGIEVLERGEHRYIKM